ncbi:hypothetical protein FHL15_006011 [Xylaria flabelliformis]|uniref:Uncharacterized protein n=1 Tax=Xylaria flabelliformis TaxID=2512241 RepID=A0A553HYX7_9PEZI|nr:hypothetical protein FHL15_006011 [Xylaria flabelliformis]
MAAIIPDTKTTSNIDHGAINLRQYSLNAVVCRNKSLWQRPRDWTQAHLQALCVDRQSIGIVDKFDGEKRLQAIIPKLDPDHLDRSITAITSKIDPHMKAGALKALLVFDAGNIIRGGLEPRFEESLFSDNSDSIIDLAVGRCGKYRLPVQWIFYVIGSLVIPYVDSAQIDYPPGSGGNTVGHVSKQSYEPCITAILIAMAQEGDPSIDDPSTDESAVIKTQLIFTHRDDTEAIHVYRGYVSQSLIERFDHPNQPPTACSTSHLIELQHIRVPCRPQKSFRRRLLNALSIQNDNDEKVHNEKAHNPLPKTWAHIILMYSGL